jgi:hypothetical protein
MDGPPPDSRVDMAGRFGWGESWQNYNNEFTWSVLDALFEVAEQAGKHPAQVCRALAAANASGDGAHHRSAHHGTPGDQPGFLRLGIEPGTNAAVKCCF